MRNNKRHRLATSLAQDALARDKFRRLQAECLLADYYAHKRDGTPTTLAPEQIAKLDALGAKAVAAERSPAADPA